MRPPKFRMPNSSVGGCEGVGREGGCGGEEKKLSRLISEIGIIVSPLVEVQL